MKEQVLFDERQVAVRGRIYKHCLIVMGVALLLHAVLQSYGIRLADRGDADLLIVIFTTMIGSIEMIVKEVYRSEKQPVGQTGLMVALMVTGTVALVVIAHGMAVGGVAMLSAGGLTHDGSMLIIDICVLVIGAVLGAKILMDKLKRSGDE